MAALLFNIGPRRPCELMKERGLFVPPDPAKPSTNQSKGSRSRFRLVALVIVVALFVGIALWVRIQATNSTVRTRTQTLVGDRDFESALEAVENWLAAEPRSGEAHFYRGRILIELNRPQE